MAPLPGASPTGAAKVVGAHAALTASRRVAHRGRPRYTFRNRAVGAYSESDWPE